MTGLEGLYFEGLIHGGAYFRNFTVLSLASRLRRTANVNLYLITKFPDTKIGRFTPILSLRIVLSCVIISSFLSFENFST